MRRVYRFLLVIAVLVVGFTAGCQPVQPVAPVEPGTSGEEEPTETNEDSAIETETATAQSNPDCPIFEPSTGEPVVGNADPLALLLASSLDCPTDVFALRDLLLDEGAQLATTMVANRGFHNPAFGSFSLFETVEGELPSINTVVEGGEFFFGHFTAANGPELIADQNPRRGSLMVELIVWDANKEAFNFYELRGTGTQGVWVYNGDSFDILEDNSQLHRQPNPEAPQFGQNLRCSGCHMAGGPIMKELAAPHNDWWTVEGGLDFGGRTPDASLAAVVGASFGDLADASALAGSVLRGLDKLQASDAFQSHTDALSLQEQLRPLFCPVELNLESDVLPLDLETDTVEIPSAFFVDSRLAQGTVTIEKAHYKAALESWNAQFPEIDRRDGDRAWETPVKATSDIMAVQTLVDQGVIDEEFVLDVLAIDMTNPTISRQRCGLLRLIPDTADTHGWKETFVAALEAAADEDTTAALLLSFLTDPDKNVQSHQSQAQQLLSTCQEQVEGEEAEESIIALFGLLAQRRAEVRASEISLGPGGEILEPGFRVIFPVVSQQPKPWSTTLTAACEVAALPS